MTTAEVIVCNVLNCGIDDIEYMFDKIADNGLLIDAVKECKGVGHEVTANNILHYAFEIALRKSFGDCWNDVCGQFEICTNCRDSSVGFLGDKEEVEDYDNRVSAFAELTGFDITEVV